MASAFHFITMGLNFGSAANCLVANEQDGAPVDYLYAHSLELVCKGQLLHSDTSEQELRRLGHSLLELYERTLSEKPMDGLMAKVANDVRQSWISDLTDRSARLREQVGEWEAVLTENDGLWSAETIDEQAPELLPQVEWLNDRHAQSGGWFRYPMKRIDSIPVLNSPGQRVNIVHKSMEFMLSSVETRFRAFMKKNQTQ